MAVTPNTSVSTNVDGWTNQNLTATPVHSGQTFTTINHSAVDETVTPSGGRGKTSQKPT